MRPDQIDRQYLKAMNIDLWVARDARPEAAPADRSRPVQSQPVDSQAAGSSAEPLQTAPDVAEKWSVATLQSSLLNLTVANTVAGSAELLVVTEGAHLTTESTQLLGSMFKAIKLNTSDWLQVSTDTQDEPSVSLPSLLDVVMPKAVVYMAGVGGPVDGLNALRGIKHEVAGIAPFVVVTFHPQHLIDNPDAKRPAWEDLKQLRQWLG